VPCAPSGEEFCSVPCASLQISSLLGLGSAVLLLLGVLRAPGLSWQCAGPLAACMSVRGGRGCFHGLPGLSVRARCSGPWWYWDSHTQPPCSLQLPHGLVAPRLGVPRGAAAALMVCAAGHVGSGTARVHAQTPRPQTRAPPAVLQQTNQSAMLASEDVLGPLGTCWGRGGGLHFLGSLSLLHSCAASAPPGSRGWGLLGLLRLVPPSTTLISQELRTTVHPPPAISGISGVGQPQLPS